MNILPKPLAFGYSLADFLAKTKIIAEIYAFFFVTEEPDQFYKATGTDAAADLLPFQTALKHHRLVSQNTTGTLTWKQIKAGVITSLSAAAVTATTPTAATLFANLRAAQGTWFDFAIDNSAGANTVTLAGGTGVSAATAVVTGGATLTVASGAVGLFRLYFVSGTVVKLYRIG